MGVSLVTAVFLSILEIVSIRSKSAYLSRFYARREELEELGGGVLSLRKRVLVFAYGRWVMGMEFVELFQAIVGIAVSLIPEGLPALITITLAIGVQRMAQRNAIIRRLPAVETLGSVSRICSDKTGTLTLMEMMVVSAATAESEYQITGNGYAPEGEVKQEARPSTDR